MIQSLIFGNIIPPRNSYRTIAVNLTQASYRWACKHQQLCLTDTTNHLWRGVPQTMRQCTLSCRGHWRGSRQQLLQVWLVPPHWSPSGTLSAAQRINKLQCTTNQCKLASWHSGRTSVSRRRTFAVLRSTCNWWVTTNVGKPSAIGQPTRSTQPFAFRGR